jgi:4-amino-4-deoxy-L-arabinose transferase-like glycosyltransferase
MVVQPSRRTYAITLFLLLLVCYGYFMPKWADWGANSRANLVYAFGDRGVLYIDDYHQNTGDKACFPGPYDAATDTCTGHYYSDKSLGPSLVALPFYMVFRAASALPPIQNFIASGQSIGAFGDTLNPEGEGIRPEAVYQGLALTFITFFAMAVPSALLGVTVFLFAARFAARDSYAFLLALAYGLGTMAFPYSNALYQHQMAAFGAFVGFFLLWRVIHENASLNWLWLVGLLFGLATITEYPVVPFLGIIFIWAAVKLPDRLALYRVIVGALPLGLIFAGYNYAAFGTPMPVGYEYSTLWQSEHQTGFMSLTVPSLERLYGLTFSPVRGIFLMSPFLLLALPGMVWLWRDRRDQRGLLAVAGFLIYNAASIMWWGGFTVGPRYLVPMLPFLALPVIFVFNRLLTSIWGRALTAVLIVISVGSVGIMTIAGQGWPPVDEWPVTFAQMNATSPLLDYSLPLFLQGDIARNYGIIIGLRGFASLIPLAVAVALLAWGLPRLLSRRDRSAAAPALQQAAGGTK